MATRNLDKVGSLGALIAAVAAPCCFPIFAAVSAAAGLGVFGRYETLVLYLFQAFALLSFIGLAAGFWRHRHIGPLAMGAASMALLAFTFYGSFRTPTLYTGLLGLMAATVWNHFCSAPATLLLRSVITCPHCGQMSPETMPTNACLFFYDCPSCGVQLKPLTGDCCVFCSYGSVPCPPIQKGVQCCT